MARIPRVVVPGYPHHVTQRGNRLQPTFFCDEDYTEYRRLVGAALANCATEVWAYCLMPNHVHLIMVPQDRDGLRCVLGEAHRRYTRRVNLREGWRGHLWQERFHSFVMEERHLLAAARYIENNPVRAGLCSRAGDWPWSSAAAHLRGEDDALVRVEPLLDIIPDWAGYLDDAPPEDLRDAIHRHTRTGRPLGSEGFVARLEAVTGRTLRRQKPGPKPKLGNKPSSERGRRSGEIV